MNKLDKEVILKALSNVMDPDLKKDLVTLNMIKNLAFDNGKISFEIELTTPACPLKDMMKNDCIKAIKELIDPKLEVEIGFSAKINSSRNDANVLSGVKNIIGVASGKGGVGKSTIAAQLAYRLHQLGAKVGVLDCDIYGPSIPILFGKKSEQPEMKDVNGKNIMVPVDANGIKLLSIGFMVAEGQPIAWRGPMISSAIKQFINDADWGELDYLILDLPPGTGDIQITIAQNIPMTGVVIVSTPQQLSVSDAKRAVSMFQMQGINVPLIGVVENMSYYVADENSNEKHYIFGKGGGMRMAEELKLPFLGQIPIGASIASESQDGMLDFEKNFNDIFTTFASEVARQVAIQNNSKKNHDKK